MRGINSRFFPAYERAKYPSFQIGTSGPLAEERFSQILEKTQCSKLRISSGT